MLEQTKCRDHCLTLKEAPLNSNHRPDFIESFPHRETIIDKIQGEAYYQVAVDKVSTAVTANTVNSQFLKPEIRRRLFTVKMIKERTRRLLSPSITNRRLTSVTEEVVISYIR